MPFEPLRTDEKLDAPVKKAPDFEVKLMVGCTGFVIAAIGGFLMAAWPFFVWQDVHRFDRLVQACVFGFVPATVFGALLTRRFGLPGACGFFASAMASALFLLLRLPQVFMAGEVRVEFRPQYPPMVQYLLPAAWLLWVPIVALLMLPKGELPTKDE